MIFQRPVSNDQLCPRLGKGKGKGGFQICKHLVFKSFSSNDDQRRLHHGKGKGKGSTEPFPGYYYCADAGDPPTEAPTGGIEPSSFPSDSPSDLPTSSPAPSVSVQPSAFPSLSTQPSANSEAPSVSPSVSQQPSIGPSQSVSPSSFPTDSPSTSFMPTDQPSASPTEAPRCVVKANLPLCDEKIATVPPDPDCDCYVSKSMAMVVGGSGNFSDTFILNLFRTFVTMCT